MTVSAADGSAVRLRRTMQDEAAQAQGVVPIERGSLWRPRAGCWSIDLVGAGDSIAAGDSTIELFGRDFRGTVIREGSYAGGAPVMMAGCRGGLLRTVSPRSYARGIPAREVLRDLISDMREEMSPDSDSAALSQELAGWVRRGGSAERALSTLVRAIPGAAWRTDEQGRILVVREKWVTADSFGQLLDSRPDLDLEVWAIDEPGILPGTTYAGRRVSEVQYDWTPDDFRATVYYSDQDSDESRLRSAIYKLAREAVAEIYYHPRRFGEVKDVHSGSGIVTFHFDDPDCADMDVRLLVPSPGAKITPSVGDRALLTFPDGDPSRVLADGWESEGKDAKPSARKGDKVKNGWLVTSTDTVGMGGVPVVTSVTWIAPDKGPPPPPIPKKLDVIELYGIIDEGSKILGVA